MYKIKFITRNEEITFDAFNLNEAYEMIEKFCDLMDRADTEIDLNLYQVLDNGKLHIMESFSNTDC